jgi:hypothetical protein
VTPEASPEAGATDATGDLTAIRVLVEKSVLVRCLDAFEEFKRVHTPEDRRFYIVHDRAVLNVPIPSREEAHQLLQAIEHDGGTVYWDRVMVIEAGNEWGERSPTRLLLHASTSKYDRGNLAANA